MIRARELLFLFGWILLLGFFFQQDYFHEFPAFSNARDQSNSLAVTKGYVINDLDFLEPQTFVYNKESRQAEDQINNTRTAVHFPIHHYLPAVISVCFDTDIIPTIRWYTFIFSVLGAFFLYKLIRLLTGSFFKSLLILTLAITSPVFVYYQSGYMPVIPSLSLAICGIYFYFSYHQVQRFYYYVLALSCITLASLSTYFFLSVLLAFFATEIYFVYRTRTISRIKLVLNTAALTLIGVSTMLYFRRVSIYGSVFADIDNLRMPAGFTGQQEIHTFAEWLTTYFSTFQLVLLAVLLLGFLISYFFYSRGIVQLTFVRPFWQFLAVYILGCVVLMIFLPPSVLKRDHLFLATFYLPLILLFTLFTKHLNFSNRWIRLFYMSSGIAFMLGMILSANSIQKEKRISGTWDIGTETVINFEGSQEFLAKNGVKPTDRLLVFNSVTPNIPFLLMNRTGYAIEGTSKEDIIRALSWRYEYIIYQNEFFIPSVYSTYPEIIQLIEIVATNGKITLCRRKKDPMTENTLAEFLNFDKMNSLATYFNNFTSDDIDNWEIRSLYRDVYWSRPTSNEMLPDDLYGLVFKTQNIQLNDDNRHLMFVEGRFYQDSLADCELVGFIYDGDELVYYHSYHLSDLLKWPREWDYLHLVYEFPKLTRPECEIGFQVYNPKKARLIMDDIAIKVF